MYTGTIRSYDRYFAQAAKLDAIRSGTVAAEVVTAKTFTIVKGQERAEFIVRGDEVRVLRFFRGTCQTSRSMDAPAAREIWAGLTKQGFTKF